VWSACRGQARVLGFACTRANEGRRESTGELRQVDEHITSVSSRSANERLLIVEDLTAGGREAKNTQIANRVAAGVAGVFADAPSLEEVKRRYIRHVIVSTHGNLSRAAAILDVDRRSLYRMIERLQIEVPGRGQS
jgi:transcriptional regulator of acetoin/glycerol metabolism